LAQAVLVALPFFFFVAYLRLLFCGIKFSLFVAAK